MSEPNPFSNNIKAEEMDLTVHFKGSKGAAYTLLPHEPIVNCSSQHAIAYEVKSSTETDRALMGYVCSKKQAPRMNVIRSLQQFYAPMFLTPLDMGISEWPNSDEHLVIVTDKPAEQPVFKTLSDSISPLSENTIRHLMLNTFMPALEILQRNQFSHHRINPVNLFWKGEDQNQMMFGECFADYAGHDQTRMFQSIETAMCDSTAIDPFHLADDFFAMGMTILFLALGQNPLSKGVSKTAEGAPVFLDDTDLLYQRLNRGSLNVFLGKIKLSTSMMALLKGLLSDTPEERWGIKQIDEWLKGYNVNMREKRIVNANAKAISFCGRDHFSLRSLVHSFGEHPTQAVDAVKTTDFETWIDDRIRFMKIDVNLAELLKPMRSSGVAGQIGFDAKVARSLLFLDPLGPIRFKGLSFVPNGLPSLFLEAKNNPEKKIWIREIVPSKLVSDWQALALRQPNYDRSFDVQQNKLETYFSSSPTFGFERCLYSLNPSLPCQSPLLGKYFVNRVEDLLPTLETVLTQNAELPNFFDPHLVAYILAHVPDVPPSWYTELSSAVWHEQYLGVIRLFVLLQERYHPQKLTKLSQFLAKHLFLVTESYHSRARQKALQKRIEDAKTQGQIKIFLEILDNPEERKQDERDFLTIKEIYNGLEKMVMDVKHQIRITAEGAHPIEDLSAIIFCMIVLLFSILYSYNSVH